MASTDAAGASGTPTMTDLGEAEGNHAGTLAPKQAATGSEESQTVKMMET